MLASGKPCFSAWRTARDELAQVGDVGAVGHAPASASPRDEPELHVVDGLEQLGGEHASTLLAGPEQRTVEAHARLDRDLELVEHVGQLVRDRLAAVVGGSLDLGVGGHGEHAARPGRQTIMFVRLAARAADRYHDENARPSDEADDLHADDDLGRPLLVEVGDPERAWPWPRARRWAGSGRRPSEMAAAAGSKMRSVSGRLELEGAGCGDDVVGVDADGHHAAARA